MPIRTNTRDAVIEAAFHLLNRDPTATLADIAAHAGVGRATLHRHFAGREDLLVALAKTAIEELDQAVDAATVDAPSYADGLRISLDVIIPLADRYWFLSREASEQDPAVSAAYDRQQRELADAIDGAKAEGSFAKDIPTAWIVQTYEHLIGAAWEAIRAGDIAPNQASALAWQTLTRGIGIASHDE